MSPPLFWVCLAAFLVTFIMPEDGFRIATCHFRTLTGLPCAGCGMTRALTCISHLSFEKAWDYHPFAFLLWPAMVLLALGAVVRPLRRLILDRVVGRHDRFLTAAFWGLFALFVGFGVARIVLSV